MKPVERARTIVEAYDAELPGELPEGVYLFDAHTHLGHDIDGTNGRYEELSAMLDRHGFSGAFVFCMDEHDREPAFCVPNDRTLAHAERSEGRLVPFVRLDLGERPLEEAKRALDIGARGIKLHPRSQAFALDDERLGPIFELAVERSVPILIHGGRGLPPIAEHLETLVLRHEGVRLIVAHAGIADMAGLAGRLGGSRASTSTPRSGARSTSSTSTARSRRADRVRVRLPVRRQPNSLLSPSGRRSSPASTTASCARCSERTRSGSQTASRHWR